MNTLTASRILDRQIERILTKEAKRAALWHTCGKGLVKRGHCCECGNTETVLACSRCGKGWDGETNGHTHAACQHDVHKHGWESRRQTWCSADCPDAHHYHYSGYHCADGEPMHTAKRCAACNSFNLYSPPEVTKEKDDLRCPEPVNLPPTFTAATFKAFTGKVPTGAVLAFLSVDGQPRYSLRHLAEWVTLQETATLEWGIQIAAPLVISETDARRLYPWERDAARLIPGKPEALLCVNRLDGTACVRLYPWKQDAKGLLLRVA